MSPDFTPALSASGGALIGLAASLMLLAEGRIAGISGIVGGLFTPRAGDVGWRLAFIGGLVVSGLVASVVAPETVTAGLDRSPLAVIAAGLLVGIGSRVGNGCTSGHGVCGLSRLSPRSAVSVATFMAMAVVTAVLGQHLWGAP